MSRLFALFLATFMQPQQVGDTLRGLNLDIKNATFALIMVSLFNILFFYLVFVPEPDPFMQIMQNLPPFAIGVILVFFHFIFAACLTIIGRYIDGQGSFPLILTVIAWLQFCQLSLSAIQHVLFFISPVLSALMGLISLIAIIWAWVHLLDAAHGFESRLKAALVVFLSFVSSLFISSLVLFSMGFGMMVQTI